MRTRSLLRAACLCGVVVLAAACRTRDTPSTPPTDAERAQMEERLQTYFRKTTLLPANVALQVVEITPSTAPGLLDAVMEVSHAGQKQRLPLTLTHDGRFMIQGRVTDLTVDPYKVAMEKIDLANQPVRGDANAAITVVEYSDFQCPFCGRAYTMLEERLLKDYAGKVKLVFKHYPLTNIHPWALAAAVASECAAQQRPEAFWAVYDYVFQHQKELTADTLKANLQTVLKDGGFDATAFGACYDQQGGLAAVQADMREAVGLGVKSTPTFYINGRRLEGAMPYESFQRVLNEMLGLPTPVPAVPAMPSGHPAVGGPPAPPMAGGKPAGPGGADAHP